MSFTPVQVVALLGFAGVMVGSFLPWAQAGFFSVNGTDGDGILTLVIGAVAFAVTLVSKGAGPMLISFFAGLLAGGIAVYDAMNIADYAAEQSDPDSLFRIQVNIGTGLYLVILSAGAGTLGSFLRIWETEQARRHVAYRAGGDDGWWDSGDIPNRRYRRRNH
jgi:hypothetical protein